MTDLMAIGVQTSIIDSGCSFKKDFTKVIYMNSYIVSYLTINQVDSYHDCVCGSLNLDIKDTMDG